MTRRLT